MSCLAVRVRGGAVCVQRRAQRLQLFWRAFRQLLQGWPPPLRRSQRGARTAGTLRGSLQIGKKGLEYEKGGGVREHAPAGL